jgi:choline dehydrogenase-like flavoprotein
MEQYDVIVIGSGAGGGTLTYALAQAGKKVLLLERGEFLPRTKDTWNPKVVTREGRYQAKESWYMPDGTPFHPYPLLGWRQHQVLWRCAAAAARAGFWRSAPCGRHLAGLADQLR